MASQSELLDLQTTGSASYVAKKYADALHSFTKAVVLARKWSPSDVFTILDQRVAVHAKLGNIDLARKDAMSMIRTNKADGRGYLRCGQLDRLEDNPSAALRWYEHGLKQVPGNDPLRPTLDAQRIKTKSLLEQKFRFSNSRDPVSTLPAELFQLVVMHLDYVDAIRALRVSKAWKVTLSRLKPLTDTIDFSNAKRKIDYKMMAAALKRLGPSSKVLIMKDLAEPATHLLRTNLERWRNYTQLEELVISSKVLGPRLLSFDKYNLKILTMEDGKIHASMVHQIMLMCSSLKVARFSNVYGFLGHEDAGWVNRPQCQSVHNLHLSGGGSVHCSLEVDPTFFASYPHLEELECRDLKIYHLHETFDLSALTSLLRLSLSSCSISWWPVLPPSVEVWDNYDTKTLLGVHGQVPKLGELVKLRFLRFNKISSPPPSSSFLPVESTLSITHLDIRTTSLESAGGERFFNDLMFGEHLRNLRELAWGGVHDEQATLTTALCSLEKLEMLSLIASPLPGAELISFLKRPDNRLQQIVLVDCENISPDTIEWARTRGIIVHVRKSQTVSNTGQRVRLQ